MKILFASILAMAALNCSAEMIQRQNVRWVLQNIPGHRVTCEDVRPHGYHNGVRRIHITNGIPQGIPTLELISDQEFERCIDFRIDSRWTMRGTHTIEVDDACEIGGRFRVTVRELKLIVEENGMPFIRRTVISKVRLPDTPTCRKLDR